MQGNMPFTFEELITDLSLCNLEYTVLVYAGIKLNQWLSGAYPPPTDDLKLSMDFPFIIKQIEGFAQAENRNPFSLKRELMQGISKTMRGAFLNLTYEAIKNYSDNNPQKNVLTQLYKYDWFLMLFALRNYSSHWENYGKTVVDRWTKKWPSSKTLTWNGLTITDKTKGEDLNFTDEYAIRLINHTLDHIYQNKSIYG